MLFAMSRQRTKTTVQRFDFPKGTRVRVYIAGKTFTYGPESGQPAYLDGVVHECVPAGIVIKGHFTRRNADGHYRSTTWAETCRRVGNEEVDRVEVLKAAE